MRLFVAVWPPPPVVAALAAMDRPAIDGVSWTAVDRMHVTLRFLGEVDDPAPVIDALDGIDASATATLGPRSIALSRRVLAMPVHGLDALAERVERALGPGDHPFQGHLTIARARRARPPSRTLEAPAWAVERVTLVRSRAGYEVIWASAP